MTPSLSFPLQVAPSILRSLVFFRLLNWRLTWNQSKDDLTFTLFTFLLFRQKFRQISFVRFISFLHFSIAKIYLSISTWPDRDADCRKTPVSRWDDAATERTQSGSRSSHGSGPLHATTTTTRTRGIRQSPTPARWNALQVKCFVWHISTVIP